MVKDRAAFTRFAEQVGLQEEQARGIDIVPLLFFLNRENSAEAAGLDTAKQVYVHQRVPYWLRNTKDPRVERFLIAETNRRLEARWRTAHEVDIAARYVSSLGSTRKDEALDLLLDIQSEAYWDSNDAPQPVPGTEAEERFQMAAFKERMQRIAIGSFASSGTDRAIRTIPIGEEVNPRFSNRLDYYFKIALENSNARPDLEAWGERHLPEERFLHMKELCEWWQEAVDLGIPIEHAKRLVSDLESNYGHSGEYYMKAERIESYAYLEIDIVPYLLHLLDKDLPPIRGRWEYLTRIRRENVLFWLGRTKDARACVRLIAEMQNEKNNIEATHKGIYTLARYVDTLAICGLPEATDLLLAIQSDEYWESGHAPVLIIPPQEQRSPDEAERLAIQEIKRLALRALKEWAREDVQEALGSVE